MCRHLLEAALAAEIQIHHVGRATAGIETQEALTLEARLALAGEARLVPIPLAQPGAELGLVEVGPGQQAAPVSQQALQALADVATNAGAEVGKVFASVNFPFREVASGTMLTPLYFRGFSSRVIQVPELTEEEKKTVQEQKNKLKK